MAHVDSVVRRTDDLVIWPSRDHAITCRVEQGSTVFMEDVWTRESSCECRTSRAIEQADDLERLEDELQLMGFVLLSMAASPSALLLTSGRECGSWGVLLGQPYASLAAKKLPSEPHRFRSVWYENAGR
jgi:hypothetical protein